MSVEVVFKCWRKCQYVFPWKPFYVDWKSLFFRGGALFFSLTLFRFRHSVIRSSFNMYYHESHFMSIFFFSLTNFFNTSFLPCSAIILISFFFALHSFIFDPHFFYISCPTYLPSECSIYFLFIYATLGGCRTTGPLGGGWENFWIRALSSSLPSFIIIIIFIMIITIQFANTRLVREIFWGGCLKCGGGEKGRWGH